MRVALNPFFKKNSNPLVFFKFVFFLGFFEKKHIFIFSKNTKTHSELCLLQYAISPFAESRNNKLL